jgi:O-antigen ligase
VEPNFFHILLWHTHRQRSRRVDKILLLAVSAANLITIANIAGITSIGIDPIGDDDPSAARIKGIFGHENETGALLAALLPAYIAVVESKRGAARLFWIGAMLVSAAVLFMTSSRGALLALLIGGGWGAYVCRKYLSMERAMKWGLIALVVAVPIVAFLGFRYWDQFVQRLTGSSTTSMDELSSGRTEIWMDGLNAMINKPSSLIVGYGWDTWALLPFRYVPHNQYLWLWFELGLVGVGCLVVALRTSVVTALAAIKVADPGSRGMLVAYVVGILVLSVSIFFANLWLPWPYLWAYIALAMRSALSILSVRQESGAIRRPEQPTVASLPKLRGAAAPGAAQRASRGATAQRRI